MMGCVQTRSFILYNETYTIDQKDKALFDINKTFYYLKMDSISMDDWIPVYYEYTKKDGYTIDRYVTKENKKTIYYLIFSTYYKDSTYYEYKLKCYTRDRHLIERN